MQGLAVAASSPRMSRFPPRVPLKEMYMGPLGVTITQTADALGVSRKHVSAIVNGRVAVPYSRFDSSTLHSVLAELPWRRRRAVECQLQAT